jgi:hypothetical protein
MEERLMWELSDQVDRYLPLSSLCGQVSYVAFSFSSQLSAANQQTERHISSRLRERGGTSLALCAPSIASTVWSPLLHKLPVPWLSSPDRFQRRCWWINRDVAQPGADGIDIYSGTQKMLAVV